MAGGADVLCSGGVGSADGRGERVDMGVSVGGCGLIVDCRGAVGVLGGIEVSTYGVVAAATVGGVGCGVCVASGVVVGVETSSKCFAGGGVGWEAGAAVGGGFSPCSSSFRSMRV